MGLFGIDVTHMSAILSSIIIGVGVDFSIHYTSEYKKLIKDKVNISILLFFKMNLNVKGITII